MSAPTELSSKEDIRGQLSDIQKRLFKTSTKHDELTPSVSPKKKKQARYSMPPIQTSHSLGPESKGNDMNFVVGLSENLLGECRRLNAENVKLKSKLKVSNEQIQITKAQIDKLKKTQTQYISNESVLNDKIWESQSSVVNLNERIAALTSTKEKLCKENNELNSTIQSIQKENESLTMKNHTNSKSLLELKSSFNKQLSDLNSKIQELNDENDQLHCKLQSRSTPKFQKSKVIGYEQIADEESEDSEEFDFDSFMLEPEPQQLPSLDANELDIENLRANLNHSNRTIAKLRSSLLKLKSENHNMSSMTSLLKSTPLKPKSNKVKKDQSSIPRSLSPSKRNSKFLVMDDVQIGDDGTGKWEDFLDVETPSKAPSRPDFNTKVTEQKRFSTDNSINHEGVQYSDSSDESDKEYLASPIAQSKQRNVEPENDFNIVKLTASEYEELKKNNIHNTNVHELSRIAEDKGLHLLQRDEYNKLIDDKEMEKRLVSKGLVVLPSVEHEELKNNHVQNVTEHEIVTIAENKGLRVLQPTEYEKLLDDNEMVRKLSSKGLKTIPQQEYDQFKDSYLHPSMEYLKEKAKANNHEIIDLHQLSNYQSENYVRLQCSKFNLHPLSKAQFDEYENLAIDHEKPSKAYLTEKANDLGFVLSPSGFYDEIVKTANNPPLEHIITHAKANNLIPVTQEAYSDLENPTIERVIDRAKELDHVVITKKAYENLKSPLLDELKSLAINFNSEVISKEDYSELVARANNPTLDQLQVSAKTLDHKLMPNQEYEQLTNPTIEYLTSKTKVLNHSIIPSSDLEALKKLAYEPNLSHVKQHAERFNLVTLLKEEYTKLYDTSNNPSVDFIKESAKSKGLEVIKQQELEKLRSKSENPTLEHLSNKAQKVGHRLIAEDELKNLESTSYEPSLEHVMENAIKHNHKVISSDEYQSLYKDAREPTLEHISKCAQEQDHVVISKDRFEVMENPSMEQLKAKAKEISHTMVPKDQYEKDQILAHSPDKHHLSEKAQQIEHTLISDNDLKNLQKLAYSPTIDELKKHAARLDSVIVNKEDYTKLEEICNTPSFEFIKENASNLGYEVISVNDYLDLNNLAYSPEIERISELAKAKGYLVLDEESHGKLTEQANSPSISRVKELANNLGYETVEKTEFGSLKEKLDQPSKKFLIEKARSYQCVLLENEVLTKMENEIEITRNMPLDTLQKKAADLGYEMVDKVELKKLNETIKSPSREFLSEKAKSHHCKLIESDVLKKLETNANSPSVDHLRLHASIVGYSIVEKDEYDELVRLANTPNFDHVKSKAQLLDSVVLKSEEFNDLVKYKDSPSEDFIRDSAKSRDMVVINSSDHSELVTLAQSPSLEHITNMANKMNMVVVPKQELEQLQLSFNSPAKEYLKEKSKAYKCELIGSEELQELSYKANSPSESHIKDKAAELGLAVTTKSYFETLEKTLNQPDRAHLESKAGELGLVVVTQEHQEILKQLADNSRLILDEEHTKLLTRANLSLEQLASEKNMEVIKPDKLESLRKTVETPDIQFLENHCHKLGYDMVQMSNLKELIANSKKTLEERAKENNKKLLDEDEYINLVSPSVDQLKVLCTEKGYSLEPTEYIEDLKAYKGKSITDLAGELNMTAISKVDYEDIHKKATTPTVDHLRSMAENRDHVLIPREIHEDFILKTTNPPLSHLKEISEKIGYTALPAEECESLVKASEEPLEIKAEKCNMKVLPTEEYLSLIAKIESPTFEYLSEMAKKHNSLILSNEEKDELVKSANRPLNEIADSQGKIVIDKGEYLKLTEKVSSPTVEHVKEKAGYLGYSLVLETELNQLQKKLENPDVDFVREKAGLYDCSIIEQEKLKNLELEASETLEEKAEKSNFVLVSKDEYAKLISPSLVAIENSARTMDCVVLSINDYKNLQHDANESIESKAESRNLKLLSVDEFEDLRNKVDSPTLQDLTDKARNLGYSVVQTDYVTSLEEDKNESIHEKAAKNNMKAIPESEYNNLVSPSIEMLRKNAKGHDHDILLKAELDRLSSLASESITQRAQRENMHVLPISEFQKLNTKVTNPKLDDLRTFAGLHDCELISSSSLKELQSKAEETLEEKLAKSDKRLVPHDEYNKLLILATKPSIQQIESNAEVNGLAVLPREELISLKKNSTKPLSERASEAGLELVEKHDYEVMQNTIKEPTLEFLKEKSSNLGSHLLPIAEFEEISNKAIQDIHTKAKEDGKVVIDEDKYRSMLDENESLNRQIRSLEFISNDDHVMTALKEKLNSFGLAVLPNDEVDELKSSNEEKKELTEEELKTFASNIGKAIVYKDDYISLSTVDRDKLTEIAKSMDSYVLSNSEYHSLKQSILDKDAKIFELNENKDTKLDKVGLKQLLAEMNLIPLEKEEYQQLKKSHATLNEKGMKVIPESEYDRLVKNEANKETISNIAKSMGLLCVPEKSFVPTTVSRVPDVNNVAVIPTTYYNKLTRNDSLSIEKVSDEIFQKHCEKRGYVRKEQVTPVLQQSAAFDERTPERAFTPPQTAVKLKMSSPTSHTSTRTISGMTASTSIRSNLSLSSRVHSVQDSLTSGGVLSMATSVSLTDKCMIPAITQVFIGEYLFKYYRRLGPLSAISESRHERYFWVHPYSLTLYWSDSNPVLTNPSELKTKAAAILDVKSIYDNNPLPTGLYHKSIVVISQNRSIKITCPNRQRHNLWYNALRYLLHRNMEDLSFDMDINGEIENDAENTIVKLQRHHDILSDVGDRHAMPRPKAGSGFFHRSDTSRDITRLR
jgi:nuclear migration protein NUM1